MGCISSNKTFIFQSYNRQYFITEKSVGSDQYVMRWFYCTVLRLVGLK